MEARLSSDRAKAFSVEVPRWWTSFSRWSARLHCCILLEIVWSRSSFIVFLVLFIFLLLVVSLLNGGLGVGIFFIVDFNGCKVP